jgi:signal peptidase II
MKKSMRYGALFLAILICDRITKWWAIHKWISENRITDYLSFHTVVNRGISWGMFHSASDSVFIAITLLITLITCALALHAYRKFAHGIPVWGEVLIISGSVSNILDRLFYHGVIDFIVLHKGDWVWPVFNGADICIVLGVFYIFLQQIFFEG